MQLKTLPKSHVDEEYECIGIGFDNESNDFKVLAYTHVFNNNPTPTMAHAKLYSLRTNNWKKVDVGGGFQTKGLPSSSSYPSINGILSWFETDDQGEKVIFSFNLKEEVFIKTRLPHDCCNGNGNGIPFKRVNGRLASLKESVAFIHGGTGGTSKFFHVWVLGEYGVRESWVKQLTIGPLLGVTAPLGLWKNGELLLEDADKTRVVSYDPVTQDMKGVHASSSGDVSQVLAYNYKESLVCFKEEDDDQNMNMNMNREVIHFSFFECQEHDIL